MMSGSRNLLWLLPVVLFITSPLWWPTASGFLKPRGDFPTTTIAGPQHSSFLFEKLEFIQYADGREDIRLQAAKAQALATDAPITMQEINATINDKTGKVFHLKSNRGKYDPTEQILTMTDSVRGTTADGYNLATESLRYLNRQKTLESDQQVRLLGPGMEILAGNLLLNTETNSFNLGGRVKVKFQPGNPNSISQAAHL